MSNKLIIWAIIPARSGSKGLKNKNIKPFLKKPLLTHSIKFAKKLSFINRIFLSTDSSLYKSIGKKNGADIPFLRSKKASKSSSMEEDVLEDIRLNLLKTKEKLPDCILWLRPTHPLRDVRVFKEAYLKFKRHKESVCIVSKTDPRIFLSKKGRLVALNSNFKNKSMVRRQDCNFAYKIFHGEFFKFPQKYNKNFLGKHIRYVVQNNLCDVDIDTLDDLIFYEKLIENNKKKYERFLHTV